MQQIPEFDVVPGAVEDIAEPLFATPAEPIEPPAEDAPEIVLEDVPVLPENEASLLLAALPDDPADDLPPPPANDVPELESLDVLPVQDGGPDLPPPPVPTVDLAAVATIRDVPFETSFEIRVSSAAELDAALETAVDGTTILLAAGNYGGLDLRGFDARVQLLSDRDAPAVFTSMLLQDVTGLQISGAVFDYTFQAGEKANARPFQIIDGHQITIRDSLFDGDDAFGLDEVSNGYGAGSGLRVRDSSEFLFTDNELTGFWKGLQIALSNDVVVRDNDLHGMRSDIMTLGVVNNVLIEGNHLHDRRKAPGSTDHADMIQLMSKGADATSTGITLRGNLFDIGAGQESQAVFLNNRAVLKGAGQDMFYRDFVIEENIIINGHSHGITVGAIDGLILRNNTLLQASDSAESVRVPKITVYAESQNVLIENNLSGGGIRGADGQADWVVRGNVAVQNSDMGAPNHYSEHFVDPYGQLGGYPEKLQLRPDSPLYDSGVGAAASRFDATPDSLTALITMEADGSPTSFRFDAGMSAGPDGGLSDSTRFDWEFSDGSTATGREVAHSFDEAGIYTVTLTVTDSDNNSDVITSQVRVAGPDLVVLDSENGALVSVAYGESQILLADPDGKGDAMLDVSGLDPAVAISRDALLPVFETGSFEIEFRMAAYFGDSASGELMRLKGAITVTVDEAGEIVMDVATQDGQKNTVSSQGARLHDGNWHDVSLTYDAQKGEIGVEVDSLQARSTAINAPMATADGRDLMLGNSFGDRAFDGQLSSFTIRANPDGYQQESALPNLMLNRLVEATEEMPTLQGTAARDVLKAGEGGMLLDGDGGNDKLWSGAGDDVMIGGAGADKFVFDLRQAGGFGMDQIDDLNFAAGDRLHILTHEVGLFDAAGPSLDAQLSSDGSDVLLSGLEAIAVLAESGALVMADGPAEDSLVFWTNGNPDSAICLIGQGLDELIA